MKVAIYGLAACLGAVGFLFLVAAAQGNMLPRLLVAAICLAAAGALIALVRLKPLQQTHIHQQQIHLSGDVSLEKLTCRQCSGNLTDKSVRVEAGAVFISCEFCGAQYQLEEAPKW